MVVIGPLSHWFIASFFAVQGQPVKERVAQHPVSGAARAYPLLPIIMGLGNGNGTAVVFVCQRLYAHAVSATFVRCEAASYRLP